jgi:hypothetical protein
MRLRISGKRQAPGWKRLRLGAWAVLLALCAGSAEAQRGGRFPGRNMDFGRMLGGDDTYYTPPDFAGNPVYDGRVTFARIKYRGYGNWSGREGPGWSHDYPDADVHLMRILREITVMRPFTNFERQIGGAIVALDDSALFRYPVAYLSEPGGWPLNDAEARGLRKYLHKGGFLIVDDFQPQDWNQFETNMRRVVPDLKPIQLTGKEGIFDSFFKVDMAGIVSSYNGRGAGAWYGFYEENDPKKRLMVLVGYAQDIGESWQWSGRGFEPVEVSNEAFKLGVNFFIWALTH